MIRLVLLVTSGLASFFVLLKGGSFIAGDARGVFGFALTYDGSEVPVWHAGIILVSVSLGVLCGTLVESIFKGSATNSDNDLMTAFSQVSSSITLLISAVIFIFVFPSQYSDVGDISAYFGSFQTGFLFKQILEGLLNPKAKQK